VRRYDIDGVQIDDYFYPYPVEATAEATVLESAGTSHGGQDFPDQASWQRYVLGGGQLERADWRRQNVNQLIEALYTGIHREKSWVRFGVSPFGVGRPDRRPNGIAGFSQYDKLYADPELWLEKGWVDYLAPQLYWSLAQAPQAYDVLLDYWLGQNRQARHIWPGMFTGRIDASVKPYASQEILLQIDVTRQRHGAGGHIHFSMSALMENRRGIADRLRTGPYASAALIPATPWLGAQAPAAPLVGVRRDARGFTLRFDAPKSVTQYAIWSRHGHTWRFAAVPAAHGDWVVADDASDGAAAAIVVSAVDRLGNESARVSVLPGAAPDYPK
jgi:uncharacterized lipoprotein YddW (UPF0748 family)